MRPTDAIRGKEGEIRRLIETYGFIEKVYYALCGPQLSS
ncbi:hypothetical protein ALQ54_200115 [Pseudomonas syringae]|nr:hypothetical protein ALO85_200151 [Pseudomonas syringae pv. aptata]RMN70874.1 hypothetical protein ALQ54_200115 [Pseudomonas syringae]RMO46109.1 hypothetical protein ALQ40_200188 [Pseudomonas syringae]